MKVYVFIPRALKTEVQKELHFSSKAFNLGLYKDAFTHLERAHILGQAWPVEHTYVHWKMLIFAFKIKDRKEILGQIPRLLVGGIKSFVGEIPIGNTGGANVPPLKSMEIPDDLKLILEKNKKN